MSYFYWAAVLILFGKQNPANVIWLLKAHCNFCRRKASKIHRVHLSKVIVVIDMSTFELLHFLPFEFYWELALTICWGHGKYLAGKTFCLRAPWWAPFFLCVNHASTVLEITKYWLLSCATVRENHSWSAVNIWHGGISHQCWLGEMMSAACIPAVGIIKKEEWVSRAVFFFFFLQSLLTPLAFREDLLSFWDWS